METIMLVRLAVNVLFDLTITKKSIRDNSSYSVMAQHLNLANHSIDNVRYINLASTFNLQYCHRKAESNYIHKLNIHNSGLNKDLGILTDNIFYNITKRAVSFLIVYLFRGFIILYFSHFH